MFCKISF